MLTQSTLSRGTLSCDTLNSTSRVCRFSLDGETYQHEAALVIAADGAGSQIAGRNGIDTVVSTTGQSAIAARIRPRRVHEGSAFERFTPDGPLALLPLRGGECGLVWCACPLTNANAEWRWPVTPLALNSRGVWPQPGWSNTSFRTCGI